MRCAGGMLRSFGPQELTNTAWALSQMYRAGVPFTPDVEVGWRPGGSWCRGWGIPTGPGLWRTHAPAHARTASTPQHAPNSVFPCPLRSLTPVPLPLSLPSPTQTQTNQPPQALLDRIPDELSLLFADRGWRARVKPQTISNLANA